MRPVTFLSVIYTRCRHNAIYDKLFEVILKVLPLTVEIWKHVGRLYWKFCRKRAADLPVAARDYLPPSDTRCGSRVYARGCCIGSRMPRGRRRSVAASRGPHLDIAVLAGNRPRMPLADPVKVQVHLDLHRLAPQVVAARIVNVFANARTGQMRARRAGVEVGSAPTRRRRLPQFTLNPLCPKRREANRRSALTAARGPSRNDDLP